jgi:hypothetical protein
MDNDRVAAEFERMQTIATLEKQREIIASYQEGLAHYREKVEDAQFKVGYLHHQLKEGK